MSSTETSNEEFATGGSDVRVGWWRRATRRRKTVVVGLATVALVVPAAAWAGLNEPFNDVTGPQASIDATEVADAGIMSGFPDGGFHPNAPATRILLARAL